MFTLFAAPVLLLEGVAILVLVWIALARIIRIDRPAGLLIAGGAGLHGVGALGQPLVEAATMGMVLWNASGSNAYWFVVVYVVMAWLPPIGRTVHLACLGVALVRLSRRIPADRWDVPQID